MSATIGDGIEALALAGGIVGYLFVAHRSRQKKLEVIHEERMAAMEKGIPLPEFPLEQPRRPDPTVVPILGMVLFTLSLGAMIVLALNLPPPAHSFLGCASAVRFFGSWFYCLPSAAGQVRALTVAEGDSQLVTRVQNGDQEAFAELVRRYRSMVFRLAVSILGREFAPEAEDVAQEVFLKVHYAIKSFRGEAEFSSWIYRITFNQAVNLKARVRFRSPHEDETVLHSAATREPGPDRQVEAAAARSCPCGVHPIASRGLPIDVATLLLDGRRSSRSGGIAGRSREYCQIVSASRASTTAWHAERERVFL